MYFPNALSINLHTSLALMFIIADANLVAGQLKCISHSYNYIISLI